MGHRRKRVAALVGVLALTVACGDSPPTPTATDDVPSTTEPDTRPAESHPFVVTRAVPDGYTLAAAGRGQQEPYWNVDEIGTDEPAVVLSPDGTIGHPDLVIVTLTACEFCEEDWEAGHADTGAELLTVDGSLAQFTPAGTDPAGARAILQVHQRDEVMLQIASPDATVDELVAVAAHVAVPADLARPPEVRSVPPGLEVVGSVAADAVHSRFPFRYPNHEAPGPTSAHAATWRRAGADDELTVMTLPGRSNDIEALVAVSHGPSSGIEVRLADDHATFESTGSGRSVRFPRDDGELVIVASAGTGLIDEDDLVELARSVTLADEATWAAFLVEARGGPGLAPDPGRTELMRGPVGDGREWLLQTQPPGHGNMGGSSGAEPWSVDPCLKLSDGAEACPASESAGPVTFTAAGGAEAGAPYLIVATRDPALVALRVVVDGTPEIVDLVPVPGTDERAAAVLGAGRYLFDRCAPSPAAAPGPAGVELVTANGAPPCGD